MLSLLHHVGFLLPLESQDEDILMLVLAIVTVGTSAIIRLSRGRK